MILLRYSASPRAPFTSKSLVCPVLELISAAHDIRAAVDSVLFRMRWLTIYMLLGQFRAHTPNNNYIWAGNAHFKSLKVSTLLWDDGLEYSSSCFFFFLFGACTAPQWAQLQVCVCLSWIWNCATGSQREAQIEPSCFLPQSLNPIAFTEQETPLRVQNSCHKRSLNQRLIASRLNFIYYFRYTNLVQFVVSTMKWTD